MSGCGCESVCSAPPPDPRYRRALWVALVLNAAMFGVDLAASFAAQSVSLLLAGLALTSGASVIRHARQELRTA
jgi:Co/Zn/Cd efflux system component